MLQRTKLSLITCLLLLTFTSAADPVIVSFLMPYQCAPEQEALGLCRKLVSDLESENLLLKQKIGILVKERDEAAADLQKVQEPRLLPDWAWFLVGIGIGAGTYAIIRR